LTDSRSRTAARSSDPVPAVRLGRAFFDRPTRRVARELLGARLRVAKEGEVREVRIVETEAYVRHDEASHTYRGRTARNRSMFGPPGTLYMFRIHQVVCANLVTRRGEAVLLRAGAPTPPTEVVASGPGRLCRVVGLTIADDGTDAVTGHRVEVLPRSTRPRRVGVGPRVGISRAVERPLRFWIVGDPAVSKAPASTASASPSRSRGVGRYPRSRTRSRPSSGGGRSVDRTDGR
jgi:DNA-3-methyladenine glycosylase